MTIRVPLIAILLCVGNGALFGQEREAAAPRRVTLSEALDLALQNNHRVRLARYAVDEQRRVKAVVKSGYFPSVHTESTYIHVTDTQLIELPAGSLGTVGNSLIPPSSLIVNQGAQTFK